MATKQERIVLETARKDLPKDVTITIEHGGKHPCIVFTRGSRSAKMPFASTPRSDDRCVANFARQGTRRALATLAMAA